MPSLFAKINYYSIILVLLGSIEANDPSKSSYVYLHNPVRSAAQDEIHELPSFRLNSTRYQTGNFKQYSGYLEASIDKRNFLHYWLFESQSSPRDDPLVFWFNGGPGCSSLNGLKHIGPFKVSSNLRLVENKHSWNRRANLVLIESPVGVGYSYSVDESIDADDESTAQQHHFALLNFMRKFPKFSNSSLILTGESYSGVYLPMLTNLLIKNSPNINLKGLAIGSGFLDASKQTESMVYLAYYRGLIDESLWSRVSRHCCGGQTPGRVNCNFSDGFNQECNTIKNEIETNLLISTINLNPYNIHKKSGQSLITEAGTLEEAMTRESHLLKLKDEFKHTPNVIYLNLKSVRKALHIPEAFANDFIPCNEAILNNYNQQNVYYKGGMSSQIRKILGESTKKVKILIYNGNLDLVCSYLANEWFVQDLNRTVVEPYKPWFENEKLVGFMKRYDGITFGTIIGSGHSTSADKPVEVLNMLEIFFKECLI